MTGREWKPGDVAMVECGDGKVRQAVHHLSNFRGPHWQFADGAMRDVDNSDARPLVVIDPEDRDQLANLILSAWPTYQTEPRRVEQMTDDMQRALRSSVAPPKPEEPTNRYAAVVDADGVEWVRDRRGMWFHTRNGQGFVTEPWSAVDAVEVLSLGVES